MNHRDNIQSRVLLSLTYRVLTVSHPTYLCNISPLFSSLKGRYALPVCTARLDGQCVSNTRTHGPYVRPVEKKHCRAMLFCCNPVRTASAYRQTFMRPVQQFQNEKRYLFILRYIASRRLSLFFFKIVHFAICFYLCATTNLQSANLLL